MTQFQVGSELSYDVKSSIIFLFKVTAALTRHQRVISEDFHLRLRLNVEDCQVGLEGNRMQRVVTEPCQLQVSYKANVELSPEVERPINVHESNTSQLTADVLTYMNPSRYCESDLLARFAFEEFGQINRGHQRVRSICDWANDHLEYAIGNTTATTTASEVLLQRSGVCRDYTHLAISLCRGIGIPARYVSG
jgi:transglutaminase-like putative cysteine protease